MKIYYNSNKLKLKLENILTRKKYYGKIYRNLTYRLAELNNANNLYEIPEVPPPRRHKLKGSKFTNCWAIDCSKNYRIIIKPTGSYDINNITSITEIIIIDITDYH